MYGGKKVLVTGGTGTIGPMAVRRLLQLGAEVTVVSLDNEDRARAVLPQEVAFRQSDLREYRNCVDACKNQDYVFHLVGVKASTQAGLSQAASTLVPVLLSNTNMMEGAFRSGVGGYLFVGSIGEYPPLDVRYEDDMWKGAPEANDRFMGVAKRAGEVQAEAYLHEYGWDAVRIVRLSNVYGPFDDFDPSTAHVIPALVHRMASGENPVKVAGDGSAVRDFIYSDDAAQGMLTALEKAPPCVPINIGSGTGHSIREIAQTISNSMPGTVDFTFDPSRPTGDRARVLATQRAKQLLGFEAETPLSDGIRKTVDWYLSNKRLADRRGKELHG